MLQKHHEKAGIYNLEEEELTHLGQSLGDIDQFDDVRLSDGEDYENGELVLYILYWSLGMFVTSTKYNNHFVIYST